MRFDAVAAYLDIRWTYVYPLYRLERPPASRESHFVLSVFLVKHPGKIKCRPFGRRLIFCRVFTSFRPCHLQRALRVHLL